MSYTPSFELGLDTTQKVVEKYHSTTFKVYVSSLYGFSGQVTLSCSVISGTGWNGSISFQTNPITPPNYTIMTINVSSSEVKKYTLRLTGQSDSIIKTLDFDVVVIEGRPYNIGVTLRDSSNNPINYIVVDENTNYTFYAKLFPIDTSYYPNNVAMSYSLEYNDTGVSVSFNPNIVSSGFTVDSPASVTITLSITTLNYPKNIIRITATDLSNSSISTTVVVYFNKRIPLISIDYPPGPPATPTNLVATGKLYSIELTWDKNTEQDFDHYEIWRGMSSGGETLYVNCGSNFFLDTNVVTGNTYYYKVLAVDKVGNKSGFSNEAYASPETVESSNLDFEPGPPSTPTGLNATAGELYILLTWNANTETDLSHYEVWRKVGAGGTYSLIATSRATYYTDHTVHVGTTYYYKIRAVDLAGNISDFSSEVSSSPLPLKTLDLNIELKPWVSDLKIWEDSSVYGKLYWSAQGGGNATIKFADGSTRTITANTTGTSFTSGLWYFYWSSSNNNLNYTQNYAEAVGEGKGLIAIADISTSAPSSIIMFDSYKPTIGAGVIAANSILATHIKAGTITADKLNLSSVELKDITFTNNSPYQYYVSWTSGSVVYKGTSYSISSGYTNKRYIYWVEGNNSFSVSDEPPPTGTDVFSIGYNINGFFTYATNTTRIWGNQIVTGSITANEITSDWITGKKFRTSGRPTGAGIEFDDNGIVGYVDATNYGFKIGNDGIGYCAGGNIKLKNDGIYVYSGSTLKAKLDNTGVSIYGQSLNMCDSGGTIKGYVYMGTYTLYVTAIQGYSLELSGDYVQINGGNGTYKFSASYLEPLGGQNLGSSSKKWNNLYLSGTAYVGDISSTGTLSVSKITQNAAQANTLYDIYPYNSGTWLGNSSNPFSSAWINKIYGTVGSVEPLKRKLNGLDDLKNVEFREDGLPKEKSLPSHIKFEKDKVKKEFKDKNGVEVEDVVLDESDTVNLCHTIGWLIQCMKQLLDRLELLEEKIKKLEKN